MAAFMNVVLDHDVRVSKTRVYRLKNSPFDEFDDLEFYSRFRFDKDCVKLLCDYLRPNLARKSQRNHALSVEAQVLTALRYFGSGSFQVVTGDTIGISQPAVCRTVTAVSEAICDRLGGFIKLPSPQEATTQNRKFFDLAGFPGVIGCIDGTHIQIVKPHEHEEQYVNHKGYHSVNAQAVCDADFKFINVVVKWPGSTHDSFILRHSKFWRDMENDPTLGIILGDSAYPLRYWLMTPLQQLTTQAQRVYNKKHSKTRVTIEQAFGQLKRRFNVLHQENRREIKHVVCDVMSCFILHNFAKLHSQPDFLGALDPPVDPNIEPEAEEVNTGHDRRMQITALWAAQE